MIAKSKTRATLNIGQNSTQGIHVIPLQPSIQLIMLLLDVHLVHERKVGRELAASRQSCITRSSH
jgi:hypothetical protein